MADYKNKIMLGIELDKASDVQGKLDGILKTLNEKKINLDINIKDSNVAKQLETLNNLAKNFKSTLGENVSLGNIDVAINQAVKGIETLKTSSTSFGNDISKKMSTVATGIGEVAKQTATFQKIDGEIKQTGETLTTVTKDLQKFNTAMDNIAKSQKQLDGLKLNGFVDINEIERLQDALKIIQENANGKNDTFSDNDLNKYLNEVKELGNQEKNLQKIEQERVQTLQTEIDLSNKLVESNQKRQTKDDNANLKQLEQEQTLLQKQELAYQQINTLKSNGVINSSEITKLEQLSKSASSIKEINSALNSIGQSTSRESSISTLTKQISDAQTKLEKMKQTFGENLPNGFVNSTEKELNILLSELKQVDGINFNGIKNSLGTVKSSMEQTNTETKQLVSSLKETNNGGFFSGISNFLGKIGVFYGVQQVVQEITTQLKNASEYTITMDAHLSNIQMISGKTREQVVEATNSFKDLAGQIHTTNTDMMSGAEEMMRAGYSESDSKKMLEQATIGAKISGQTTEQVSQQLITLKNSFNMSADEMSHVIDIFSKMDNTSATSLNFEPLVA